MKNVGKNNHRAVKCRKTNARYARCGNAKCTAGQYRSLNEQQPCSFQPNPPSAVDDDTVVNRVVTVRLTMEDQGS